MARGIVRGSGQRKRPRVFLCGERPGYEEYRAGEGFVGPSGEELWSRLARIASVHRDECWVTNLVKTFSMDPPTYADVARWAPVLRRELRTIRPRLIVTVGAHAARWFLPQFRGYSQDYFHGLAFATPRCPGAVVVPLVHSAAALRQPDLYQHQFTEDCRALARVLRRLDARVRVPLHVASRPRPVQVGLAGIHRQSIGLDTEGFLGAPECVTVSSTGMEAALVECGVHRLDALRTTIATAPAIAIHHAKHDWQILAQLRVDLPARRVRCTMLEAYALGLPQALKVLAFRLFGWVMSEYDDVVGPLDDALVVRILEAAHGQFKSARDSQVAYDRAAKSVARVKVKRSRARARGRRIRETPTEKAARQTYWRLGGDTRRAQDGASQSDAQRAGTGGGTQSADRQARTPADESRTRPRHGRGSRETRRAGGGDSRREGRAAGSASDRVIPARCLTSLKGIIEKPADTSRRARWLHSTFAPLVSLPPAPTWRDVPNPQRTDYALTDAIAHRNVHTALAPRLAKAGLERISHIDHGVLPFLVRNEMIGMAVDTAEVTRLDALFAADYARVCASINRLAGRDVNPLAAEDISDTIFQDWGVTPTRLTATGFYTTADKYLKARKHEHEGMPLVIEARQINKYRGTYVSKLNALLRDGRYHPDWKYTRTSTGRPAETIILLIPKHDPSAYAIHATTGTREPIRMDRAKAIRNCFHATDGHALVSCDLSQIEMRMMAHESRDPLFLKAYRENIDMHAMTAHHLLGAPKRKEDQDESAHRLPSKTLNFMVLMGATEYGFLDQLHEQGQKEWVLDLEEEAARRVSTANREAGIEIGWEAFQTAQWKAEAELRRLGFKSAREFLAEWFKVYPGVRVWCDAKIAEAEATGYVRDFRGRRIAVDGVWSSNDRIAAEFRRKAHATPIQSGAISIAKRWIARIERHVLRPRRDGWRYCEPWVWVHDDVTVECDARIRRTVAREMLALVPQDLCVPVTADAKSGVRWGELH